MQYSIAIVLGFVAGAIVGVMYGQSVKSRLGESVTTRTSGGKVIVEVDAAKALVGGLAGYLS